MTQLPSCTLQVLHKYIQVLCLAGQRPLLLHSIPGVPWLHGFFLILEAFPCADVSRCLPKKGAQIGPEKRDLLGRNGGQGKGVQARDVHCKFGVFRHAVDTGASARSEYDSTYVPAKKILSKMLVATFVQVVQVWAGRGWHFSAGIGVTLWCDESRDATSHTTDLKFCAFYEIC